ncbi:hypothetical protein [Comamonas sp. 4034]|uniref:hypothetical protein n=1 Tax=Comamonas sp. 4034 TaxID=3156455 RepID=UPI003D1FE076
MTTTSPESAQKPAHPDQTRLALAALAACFAVSQDEQSESFLPKFEAALKDLFHHIGDTSQIDSSGALETLRWTNEYLQVLKSR